MEKQLYYDIYQYLDNFVIPEGYNEQQINRIVQTAKHYYIENEKLYRKNQNETKQHVITPKHVETILYNIHKDITAAHLGVNTTYEKIKAL